MLLGDMGAEILKLEPPGGDDCRHWGPPFIQGESAYFLAVNRNKKSLSLNLKHPEGRKLVERLISQVDVLIENFRPGTMGRLGLGYEELSARHPRLIYCSISGYGQTGPLRERAGYDAVMQGEAGWMALTGEPEGMPMKLGASLADIFTGMMASQGILASLHRREKTGEGDHVDVSLFDSVMATLCYHAQGYLMTGEVARRLGNRHPSLTPYETFETRDGHVIAGVGNDSLWRRFTKMAGKPELEAPDFATNEGRVARYDELHALLVPLFREKTTDEWVGLFDEAGIPVGRVRNVAEVFENPQVEARNMRLEVEHPVLGTVPLTGNPIKLTRAGERAPLPPPILGEHTRVVLQERLNLDAATLRSLEDDGVFGP